MIPASERDRIKDYLENLTGSKIRNRRIKSIRVNPSHHAQPPLYIEVGKECRYLEPESPPELVVAIFEATVFFVCTPERGAGQGLPYFFAREDVHQVELAK